MLENGSAIRRPMRAGVGRRTRKPVWPWLLILLVPFGILSVVALLYGLSILLDYAAKEEELTAEERLLILDIQQLSEWMPDYTPDPAFEKIEKLRYFDGSLEISYEFDVGEEAEAPYLAHSVHYERSLKDALTLYATLWAGLKASVYFFGEGVQVTQRNDLLEWGDQCAFGLLKNESAPVGNYFLARKGRLVVYVIFVGVYFDDADSVGELLNPILDRTDTQKW